MYLMHVGICVLRVMVHRTVLPTCLAVTLAVFGLNVRVHCRVQVNQATFVRAVRSMRCTAHPVTMYSEEIRLELNRSPTMSRTQTYINVQTITITCGAK